MRGSRTWFALAMNWVFILGLVIAGNFHIVIGLCGMVVMLISLVIVSGEMKWWRADIDNLKNAMKQLGKTTATMMEQKDFIRNIPVAPKVTVEIVGKKPVDK